MKKIVIQQLRNGFDANLVHFFVVQTAKAQSVARCGLSRQSQSSASLQRASAIGCAQDVLQMWSKVCLEACGCC
jgi:hypothetical protein